MLSIPLHKVKNPETFSTEFRARRFVIFLISQEVHIAIILTLKIKKEYARLYFGHLECIFFHDIYVI